MSAQANLASLEREAKENVYAVLDPHIQYDITINKHGEPPKYLSLSKPLTHQRTHAFDPCYFANDINNNNNKLSTFKPGHRKSDRSHRSKSSNNKKNYVCRSNIDVEYSKDPLFGMVRGTESKYMANAYARSSRNNVNRMKSTEERKNTETVKEVFVEKDFTKPYPKRTLNHIDKNTDKQTPTETLQNNKMESVSEKQVFKHSKEDIVEDCRPRPGKVREIASKFDKNSKDCAQSIHFRKERPKPIQSYGHQAYLDYVFPDAVEI